MMINIFACCLIFAIIQLRSCIPLNAHIEDLESDIKGEINVSLHNIDEVLKKLGIVMEKPKEEWKIPEKILMHPTSCEKLNYCKGEYAPPSGTFYRHPIYPWWFYSCEGTKVKCHSCHKDDTQDKLILFYSERCQKCIMQYAMYTPPSHGWYPRTNSENVVYLVNCKTCNKQYVGSSEPKFRLRYNNYKSCNRKYVSGANHIPQASFHAHFAQLDHNGMEDWSFILIDQGQNIKTTRRKESFWQHRLGTFVPDGLNKREVAWDNG